LKQYVLTVASYNTQALRHSDVMNLATLTQ